LSLTAKGENNQKSNIVKGFLHGIPFENKLIRKLLY